MIKSDTVILVNMGAHFITIMSYSVNPLVHMLPCDAMHRVLLYMPSPSTYSQQTISLKADR